MIDQTLSLLIHADSKAGKTTFAATAPRPILSLDAEGGTKFLALRKIAWDPIQYAPPIWDGTWDMCVVKVHDWNTVRSVYQWLLAGEHPFRSLIVDSITEIQRRCKKTLSTVDHSMRIQDWGALLDMMDDIIRGFRDLTLHPTRPIEVAVFIAETRNVDNKWRPYMQGQISTALPYWMDIVGYLFVTQEIGPDGQATLKRRQLLISPHPQYEAGERVQGRLGDVFEIETHDDGVVGTDIQRMLKLVYPQTQEIG